MVINHPLCPSSIFYDPQHPPSSIYVVSEKIQKAIKLLAHCFCFFPFAKEITSLHFVYSSCILSTPLQFFSQFPYISSSFLTASATSSFHHHVSLCLHGPFDNLHVTCAVSIIIFFICCQCSIHLHQGISTLLQD